MKQSVPIIYRQLDKHFKGRHLIRRIFDRDKRSKAATLVYESIMQAFKENRVKVYENGKQVK